MTHRSSARLLVWPYLLILAIFAFTGCGKSHDETVAGVEVPIPRGMTKSAQQGMEVALPGFGGAQANYQGTVGPDQILEFYKEEMPARGWHPAAGVLSKGGVLSYTREGKAVVVIVGAADGKTALTLMVGGAPR